MSDLSTSNGLKLAIRPTRDACAAGTIPVLNVTITNVAPHDIVFCDYLLEHRLLCTLRGGQFECFAFGATPRPQLASSDLKLLRPGAVIQMRLDVAAKGDYGFLPAGDLPASFDLSQRMDGFPAGVHLFVVNVGTTVSFFNAPDGVHDRKRDRVEIKSGLSGASDASAGPPLDQVWEGDMTAWTEVLFS